MAAVIGACLLLVLALFYIQGSFDESLYDVGLNWEACGLEPGGEILCGDELAASTTAAGGSIESGVESLLP